MFYVSKKHQPLRVSNLDIDTSKLASLGASFLLSSVLIENYAQLKLDFLGRLEDDAATIDMYVYKVPDKDGI